MPGRGASASSHQAAAGGRRDRRRLVGCGSGPDGPGASLAVRRCPRPIALLALGADLPVCLAAGPQLRRRHRRGIGRPHRRCRRPTLLLANPRRPLPTVEVFRRYAKMPGPVFADPARWRAGAGRCRRSGRLLGERGNDLTDAAIAQVPEIGDLLNAICSRRAVCWPHVGQRGQLLRSVRRAMRRRSGGGPQVLAPNWWVRATRSPRAVRRWLKRPRSALSSAT